jgi:hypothetical protein
LSVFSSFVLVFGVLGCDPLSSDPEEASAAVVAEEEAFRINVYACCGDDRVEPGEVIGTLRAQPSFFRITLEVLDGVAGNVTVSWTSDPPGGPVLYLYGSVNPSGFIMYTTCNVEPGDYVLSIHGRRTDGAVATTPLVVRVDEGVSASAVADFVWEQEGLTLQFTDATIDDRCGFDVDPGAWSWSFGDGTNSTEENPTHTYAAPGNYTVELLLPGTVQYDHSRGVLVYSQVEKTVTATAP